MESGWRSDCLSGYVSALPWLSPSSNIRRILPIFQNQSFSRPTKSFNRVSNALFSIIRCNNFSRFSYYVHRPWNLSSFFALWNQSWSIDRKIFRWMIGVDRGRNCVICAPFGTLNELPPALRDLYSTLRLRSKVVRNGVHRIVTLR